jgi:hypothetical protein
MFGVPNRTIVLVAGIIVCFLFSRLRFAKRFGIQDDVMKYFNLGILLLVVSAVVITYAWDEYDDHANSTVIEKVIIGPERNWMIRHELRKGDTISIRFNSTCNLTVSVGFQVTNSENEEIYSFTEIAIHKKNCDFRSYEVRESDTHTVLLRNMNDTESAYVDLDIKIDASGSRSHFLSIMIFGTIIFAISCSIIFTGIRRSHDELAHLSPPTQFFQKYPPGL